jgi:hypothetical protein
VSPRARLLLTSRGRALATHIASLDDIGGDIRAVQDKFFQGIMPMEFLRRAPIVAEFKKRLERA